MNYVGSISILDRGDAPAQAVIDRNARSLAQRVADETKDELHKVLDRVEHIYGNFELGSQLSETNRTSTVEYANDLAELEELIGDQVKKKKYQQQVTIFIVGYENVCGQKLRLLSQVNEFFMDNTNRFEEDETAIKTPDLDLDEMAVTIEETLKTTESLADRLGELNRDIVEYMYQWAQAKASNKGKKKLEKALSQAKEDMAALSQQLNSLQQELEEKEDKVQTLFQQIEIKNMDAQRFKTAAEVAKKSAEESDQLREDVQRRDAKINEMRQHIDKIENELDQMKRAREQTQARLNNASDSTTSKMKELADAMEGSQMGAAEARRAMQQLHEEQLSNLAESHRIEMEDMKTQHEEEIRKLMEELESTQEETTDQLIQANRDIKELNQKLSKAQTTPLHRRRSQMSLDEDSAGQKSNQMRSRQSSKQNLFKSDAPVHEDEHGDGLATLAEDEVIDFDDEFDLTDDNAWTSVPPNHVYSRFIQYRKLCVCRLDDLEQQLNVVVNKAQVKVGTLKAQFMEHKSKWEKERAVLIKHIDQAQSMQGQAEEEANAAINQLEEFINEQEQLEEEEIERRKSLGEVGLEDILRAKPEPLQLSTPSRSPAADMSQDLLAQTDDAKSVELSKRRSHSRDSISRSQSEADGQRSLSAPSRSHSELKPQSRGLTPKESLLEEDEIDDDPGHVNAATQAPSVAQASPIMMSRGVSAVSFGGRSGSAHSVTSSKAESAVRATPKSAAFTEETPVLAGSSPEEVIRSAAQSRASMREQHRKGLASLKASQEDRRTQSPALASVRSRKSVLSEAELDENGDMPFPADESKAEREARENKSLHDMATSPMTITKERTGDSLITNDDNISEWRQLPMSEHPVVQEYLRSYEGVLTFKEQLAKLFTDKDMMSLAQSLHEIEPVGFDKDCKVQPQIEEMTTSCYAILEESINIINNMLSNEREYPVSSLSHERASPDMEGRDLSAMTDPSRASTKSVSTTHSSRSQELRRQYEVLQSQYEEDKKKYDDQLSHNTVLMLEMQDTINSLQRELASITTQAADLSKPPGSPPIMFSRLDSERNAKTMKRAVIEQKLDPSAYRSTLHQMDEYVNLPAKRLAHLVHKYVHHCQMKQVEQNVRKKKNLDENVFNTLEKMEDLQKDRAQRWAEHMDAMGDRRMQLAHMLMDSMDNIEQESGIFLIKPMYSFKPSTPDRLSKMAKYSKNKKDTSAIHSSANYAPQSTPAKQTNYGTPRTGEANISQGGHPSSVPLGNYPHPVWNQSASEVTDENHLTGLSHLNMPRMLELDVNRMLIGHNQISMRVPPAHNSSDRLVNAANANVRSYMTVNRPFGPPPNQRNKLDSKRPKSSSDVDPAIHEAGLRPNSSGSGKSSRDGASGRSIPCTPPLPPIGSASSRGSLEVPLPPSSPPGSSFNQTATPFDERATSGLSSVAAVQ